MNPKTYYPIAIDVSKKTLQIHCSECSISLENSDSGFKKIIKLAKKQSMPLVVFEASGGYERELRNALHESQVPLCLLNASLVRSFAKSEGIKAKSDPIDARVIWRFAQEKSLRKTQAPRLSQRRLVELMDRRTQLQDTIVQEKGRLDTSSKLITKYIKEMIKRLEAQVQQIESRLRQLVQSDTYIKRVVRDFQSVSGVGEVTAWTLRAYLPELSQLKRNAAVAMAGVAPYNKDSGSTHKPRSIQGGRVKVRKCLFMAAMSAARHNDHIKAYYQRLRAAGKPPKCALVAVTRKLLIHLRSIERNPEKTLAN